jgi:hypothetical protein
MLPRCCKYGEELRVSETRLADGLAFAAYGRRAKFFVSRFNRLGGAGLCHHLVTSCACIHIDEPYGLMGCLGQLALTAMDGTVTLSTKWFSAAELRRT